jgi:hypothetical protein
MPFRRITKGRDKGKYQSPSGKILSRKQVKLYYSTKGWSKKPGRR